MSNQRHSLLRPIRATGVLVSLSEILEQDSPPTTTLKEQLEKAVPAEAPTEPYLLLENEYPALRSLRGDAEIGDGLWICCSCHHENVLRHWKGAYPFKFLHCNRCKHIMCTDCHSTEILAPWAAGLIQVRPPPLGQEVRYCQVCSSCGLTHRAEMEGITLDFHSTTCAGCGASSWGGSWPRYHIGNVEPYRRDPDASFAKLVDARAEDAAKLAYQRQLAVLEVEQEDASRSSPKTPLNPFSDLYAIPEEDEDVATETTETPQIMSDTTHLLDSPWTCL